jgi:Bardet-Biedl syndrome 4 protein
MRRHDYPQAFDMFGRCLLSDPFNHPAVLAMGTMLQQHGEPHAGLMKYRVLANSHHLNSSLMWNNIGMAFYHRQKFIAVSYPLNELTRKFCDLQGLACLKRALYLAPMDWRLLHNLGLICLRSHQYASANIYLTAAALINPEHGQTFHWLAVTLVQLDDYRNAMQSYEYAMQHAP